MKAYKLFLLTLTLIIFMIFQLSAQPSVTVVVGKLRLNDGSLFRPDQKKYAAYEDSLNLNLKVNPSDTTSLFYRAFLYSTFNSIFVQPAPGQPAVMVDLIKAKNMVEKAVGLKMQDYRLKVLRAQIYGELCYQYGDDQSWKYNAKQIAERRDQFNSYKTLVNKYYDELAILDSSNAYDYQKLKVKEDYPIK
ncbi:hypothetical protein AB6735_22215 [Mucilaginibacter sp. RCC_168]|uniref:hypothetical protein n=1 Tax=Mucilaginibacter sp. RCC_168 TaxID=3239221 RepID=UPI003525C5CB